MYKSYTLLLMSLFTLFACTNSGETVNDQVKTEEMEKSKTETSLKELLEARKENFNASASEEKKDKYARGIEAVESDGTLDRALKVGAKAPNFTLNNALGEAVSLDSYLAKGPVVLTWYRGGWCPYCNLTLAKLQEELPKIQSLGANLLALTPELPDSSISTSEKHELTFEVLSDLDNQVARQYGLVFKLIPEVAELYQAGFGLHEFNGNDSDELPLAATYIIDTDGTIVYAFLDKDYRNRAEPRELTAFLKANK